MVFDQQDIINYNNFNSAVEKTKQLQAEKLKNVKATVASISIQKSSSPSLQEEILTVCSSLRERGFQKHADSIEEKFVSYLQSNAGEIHLYRAIDEDGEDLLEFAHPDGDKKIAPANNDLGDVETKSSQQKKDVAVVSKQPTGKLAQSIVNQCKIAIGGWVDNLLHTDNKNSQSKNAANLLRLGYLEKAIIFLKQMLNNKYEDKNILFNKYFQLRGPSGIQFAKDEVLNNLIELNTYVSQNKAGDDEIKEIIHNNMKYLEIFKSNLFNIKENHSSEINISDLDLMISDLSACIKELAAASWVMQGNYTNATYQDKLEPTNKYLTKTNSIINDIGAIISHAEDLKNKSKFSDASFIALSSFSQNILKELETLKDFLSKNQITDFEKLKELLSTMKYFSSCTDFTSLSNRLDAIAAKFDGYDKKLADLDSK